MGKSYLEGTVKRFLKRKVKISLGLIVAFMISGSLGYAESVLDQQENYNKVIENLSELGNQTVATGTTDVYDAKNNKQTVTITRDESTGKTTIKIDIATTGASNNNNKFTFDDRLVSKKVEENIENALKNGYKKIDGNSNKDDRTYEINDGIAIRIDNAGAVQRAGDKTDGTIISSITNNGILFSSQATVSDGSEAINNGIIYSAPVGDNGGQGSGLGLNGGFAKNTKLYNNGLIITNYSGQDLYKSTGSKIFNHGVISSEKYGQTARDGANKNEMYNYGIIEAKLGGQYIVSGSESILENYGTIKTNGVGQYTVDKSTNKAYNYGLITVTNGYGMAGAGEKYNYGVIHSTDSSEIFGEYRDSNSNSNKEGVNVNKGIIITDKKDVYEKDWAKTGITLDTSFNLKNTDTAIDIISENNKLDSSSFGGKNIGYVNATDNSAPITLSHIKKEENGEKKILGVVADDKDRVVFKGDKDLFLNGVDLIGYLINGGTLIDMKDNNLLLQDATITVTEDLTLTNGEKAVAIDLGDSGNIALIGTNKINGVIKAGENSEIRAVAQKITIETNTEGTLKFENGASPDLKETNYTEVTLSGVKADNLETEFTHTSEGKVNTINILREFVLGNKDNGYDKDTAITDSSSAGNKVIYNIDNLDNIYGKISMGEADNFVTVNGNFEKYDGVINLGGGDDTLVVEGNGESRFNVKVTDAETIELQGGAWGNWNDADGEIKFSSSGKANNSPNLVLGEKTVLNITLNGSTSDFTEYMKGEKVDVEKALITGKEGSVVKYIIGDKGISKDSFQTYAYSFKDGSVTFKSAILKVENVENGGVTVSVKSPEEMGLSGQAGIIYGAYLEHIQTGKVDPDIVDKINDYDSSDEFVEGVIMETQAQGLAYYIAGSVVTKDITNTYLSTVENFTKRARKGEWLGQGKYINSDVEFNGGSAVKGYDGDITGTVGMIEYGVTDSTAFGVAYGQGDSEMDIQGGGSLEGDNTYVGLYMKHRTLNGIELVGNIGYMENDMDSVLKSDFGLNGGNKDHNTYEEGSADSSAVILSLKGRKDYRLTDTVKLQPTLGGRITIVKQDEASNPEMHFTIEDQEIIVLEGIVGMGVAKEFALPKGGLEVSTGVEYTFATSSTTNDAGYRLFDEEIKLEEVDTAQDTGSLYFGVDYEHENGIGFNGKYEMLWSDKGDDSRVSAGVSYRF